MRRRTLFVALAGLAVVLAVGVVVLWPSQPNRITQENCDRIKEGMSRAEVEAILGPPGDYRTGPGETGHGSTGNMFWTPEQIPDVARGTDWSKVSQSPDASGLWAMWFSDSAMVMIGIDDSGTVVFKRVWPRRTTQGPLANLLWRLKRQWHRWFPE
jgi:hypothetical protein